MSRGYDTAVERKEFFKLLGINIDENTDKAW
jgi:hypothetical protein